MTLHLPDALPFELRAASARGELLRVVVGSRLHGFSHATSDHDIWVVVDEPRDHNATWAARKVFQGIDTLADGDVVDVTVVGLSTFGHYCAMGAPQALEVMFAPHPVLDQLGPYRQAYRANPVTATASYRRQLRDIVTRRAHEPKQRRHAFRLGLNLNTLRTDRRFNPALTDDQRRWVLAQAAQPDGFTERLQAFTGLDLSTQ